MSSELPDPYDTAIAIARLALEQGATPHDDFRIALGLDEAGSAVELLDYMVKVVAAEATLLALMLDVAGTAMGRDPASVLVQIAESSRAARPPRG